MVQLIAVTLDSTLLAIFAGKSQLRRLKVWRTFDEESRAVLIRENLRSDPEQRHSRRFARRLNLSSSRLENALASDEFNENAFIGARRRPEHAP